MLYWLCHVCRWSFTLFASILCELQCRIDICVDEATNLCMQFNSKKCSVICFGPRYHFQCADVTMLGNSIKLVNSVKLLGVLLSAYKKFCIDIGYMKSKFFIVLLMVCFTMPLNWKMNLLLCILFHHTVNHAWYMAQKLWLWMQLRG